MESILGKIKGDKVIWIIVILLSVMSLLAVYSSISTLAYKSGTGNQEIILVKHTLTICLAIALMFFVHKIKFNYFSRISQIAFWISIPLLLLTLLVGTNLNDASRWLVIPGLGISFQTSDFAKVALIMYIARTLAKRQDQIKDFKSGFLPVILPVAGVCALILPANFSTAAVLFLVCVILLFIGGVSLKYLFAMVGVGVAGFALLVLLAFSFPGLLPRLDTWKARVENFVEGEGTENYQVNQAKIAIATAGVLGKGPGGSTQRNFLPHPYSDFIFAFIIEEYGLPGAFFVVFLYMLLLYRTMRIVTRSANLFGSLIALGAGLLLVFQAMINMAVSVNLFPVTGQPLPFISKGGTSILFTGIALGIILSVSRSVEEEQTVKKGGALATA